MTMLNRYLVIAAALLLLLAGGSAVAAQSGTDGEAVWTARYWNNLDQSGEPAVIRTENVIDHDWGAGSPAPAISPDRFSARWTASVPFSQGTYRFTAVSDDGIRVWLDDEQIIDNWTLHSASTDVTTRTLASGTYEIVVEYFENTGDARAYFSWQAIDETDEEGCGATYTVQPGDWPYRIARLCGTSLEALLAANPSIADGRTIYPGQVLTIPAPDIAPSVSLIPGSGPVGADIQLAAVGFPPNAPVTIGIGRAQSEPVASLNAVSNESGTVNTTIILPPNAAVGEQWVVLVSSGQQSALSSAFTVTAGEGDVTATPQVNLNFRPAPTLNSTPVAVVPAGTVVPVLGRDAASDWLLVAYNGQNGWIAAWLADVSGSLGDVPLAGDVGAFPRDDEAIVILRPGPGSRVTSPLRIEGMAGPAQHQELEVRLLLDDGSTLAQVPISIEAPLGQHGSFDVGLPFTISGERQAFLQVLNLSARDGAITHLSSVGITLASSGAEEIVAAGEQPARVTIYQPAPQQSVSGGLVSVSGFGLASFEQNLVVEVQDASGRVVGSEPVTVESTELGQPGPFSVDVTYSVPSSGPGRIIVRDPSAAFGGDVYVTSVEVTLAP
jgi:LysM repeat protein